MTAGPHPADVHADDAPRPERGRAVPPVDQVIRGLALGGLAAVFAIGGLAVWRRLGLIGLPLTLGGGLAALLSTWAAVIHITGGERFDDHPFI